MTDKEVDEFAEDLRKDIVIKLMGLPPEDIEPNYRKGNHLDHLIDKFINGVRFFIEMNDKHRIYWSLKMKEVLEKEVARPPHGIKPKFIWLEEREKELVEVLQRYKSSIGNAIYWENDTDFDKLRKMIDILTRFENELIWVREELKKKEG